jgi:hypothetical protein
MPDPYLRALAGFAHGITSPYKALLARLGGRSPDVLHHAFVTAMISGDLAALEEHLDTQHGPRCFARHFQAPAWNQAA